MDLIRTSNVNHIAEYKIRKHACIEKKYAHKTAIYKNKMTR